MTNSVLAGAKSIGQHLFGGYAELLRIPHTARFSVGSVIACMPFPMVGMTITISVQHYYGNYSLAGALTAVQAIALAVASPVLGKLVDKFGQRQVSIPTIIVWMIAATALVSCITARVPSWILFCIVPFMAAIPPWGAMSRQRWTTLLKGDTEKTNRALSLSGVFDECMWVIGNPLASTLAVISGLLAFSFTGVCVVVGALMFLTELSTEPKSQTQLAREAGMTRKEYREREAARSKALQAEAAIEYARDRARSEGKTAAEVQAAMDQAAADVKAGRKESIWGPGLIAVCVTWFGLGAFQSAASISIVAFATEANMKQYTGFVFACFSFSSLIGARVWRKELDYSAVEAFLLLPCRGRSRHRLVHVRQTSVGDHDHLPVHRRMPGTDVGERQPADAALGAAHTLHRRHGLDGCDELNRRFRRLGDCRPVHRPYGITRWFHCSDGSGAHLAGDRPVRLQVDQGLHRAAHAYHRKRVTFRT